ncbi:MAG: NADAR family protein [Chitinophagaceae bacterium]|nr:NADAR family protein [Chitinophagaceae bacterium]
MGFSDILPGYMHYDMDWLIGKYENDAPLKYIYFWGHTAASDTVGKECFSQWYPGTFTVNNVVYKTAEHWMMAQKALLFRNPEIFRKIVTSEKPGEVKELGRQIIGFDELIWDAEKYNIVRLGNIHKFNQHKALKEFLLSSDGRVLVEASPLDNIWGIGLAKDSEYISNLYAWPGTNLLGFALMEVRDFLLEFGDIPGDDGEIIPPWRMYPGIHPSDMFYRMGEGEEYVTRLSAQFGTLDRRARVVYYLNNPAPYEWKDFYWDFV